MKKNLRIRFTAAVMVFILVLTVWMPAATSIVSATETNPVYSEEIGEDSEDTVSSADIPEDTEDVLSGGGLMQEEVINLGEVDEDEIYVTDTGIDLYGLYENEDLYGSAQYKSAWDIYSTNYYYNQMDDEHKRIWEDLDNLCLDYLTDSGMNAVPREDSYSTELVYYECPSLMYMSEEEIVEDMINFARIFRISNPQYYFLKSTTLYGISRTLSGYSWVFAIGIYPSFQKGTSRASYSAKVKAQADTWITQVKSVSDSEKLKRLHDNIANKVTYNHGIVGADGRVDASSEDHSYSQSAYSVFCTNTTVCAGYSQALEMVLNGAGIDCIAVTSYNHEWNKVNINGSWYNVDCTWDDLDNAQGIWYKYYGRSDRYYASDENKNNRESHNAEYFWWKYLPDCSSDTNPSSANNYRTPGNFPSVLSKAAQPSVMTEKISAGEEQYKVTMSSTEPGAKIYYTLNADETPSEAFYKSTLYKESFITGGANIITAVAVSNGKENSSSTVCKWHMIEFVGTGADYGIMRNTGYYDGGSTILSVNNFRKKDHLLKEWNTKADGSGVSYEDGEQIDTATEGWNSDVTLYAQWVEDFSNYSISYVLNGGIQNASNRTAYKKSTDTFSLYAPKRADYVFTGWYLDAGLRNRITEIPYRSEGNITLYAGWKPEQFPIVYHLDGGTNNGANPATYDITKAVTFQNPKKTGYTFAGWYSDAGFKNRITNIGKGSRGSRNLYAKWTANKYTIVFKANGGRGKMSKMTCVYGKKYKLKNNKFTREGYKFVGWTTKKNGKGKLYKNKKQIKNLTAASKGKVVLYAKWKKLP